MKELSIFIDESGDFGEFMTYSPYYIVTLVLHDQSVDISENINILNKKVKDAGFPDFTVHSGPLIRREKEFKDLSTTERKRIFNFLYNFTRTIDITYYPIIVEKKELGSKSDLNTRIKKQLSSFLESNAEMFMQYERIVVYYDYGQMELSNILVKRFNASLSNVSFKKVEPANYKLFQAADMLCTLELLALKAENKALSNSELLFFISGKELYKSYLKAIQRKRFSR
jgi:hypothetical protein